MKSKFKSFARTTPFLIGAIMCCLAIACIIAALTLPLIEDEIYLREGFFPLICSSLLLIFSALYLVQRYRGFDPEAVAVAATDEEKAEKKKKKIDYFLWVFVMPLGLALATYLMTWLGTYVVIAGILLVWFKIFAGFKWLKTIIMMAAYLVVLYLVFTWWLMVPFPTFLGLGII